MALRLSGRQLAIIQVLWDRGESTVADVQAALAVEPSLAYSTVATVLARMEKKGIVRHREEGRTYFYRAAVSEGGMVGDLVDRLFGGRPSELVSHLLESSQVDAEELDRIKQLIEAHETATKPSKTKGAS